MDTVSATNDLNGGSVKCSNCRKEIAGKPAREGRKDVMGSRMKFGQVKAFCAPCVAEMDAFCARSLADQDAKNAKILADALAKLEGR
jgi:hypothetical protein